MAIRWRKNGRLICAAMSEAEEGDTYIDGRLSYELTVELQVIVADPNHKANGLWYWARDALIVADPLWKGREGMERTEDIKAKTWRLARSEVTRMVSEKDRTIELISLKKIGGPDEEEMKTYRAHFLARRRGSKPLLRR